MSWFVAFYLQLFGCYFTYLYFYLHIEQLKVCKTFRSNEQNLEETNRITQDIKVDKDLYKRIQEEIERSRKDKFKRDTRYECLFYFVNLPFNITIPFYITIYPHLFPCLFIMTPMTFDSYEVKNMF